MNNKSTMVFSAMIAFAVLLTSCKKDKDAVTGDTDIAGRYRMTALVEITTVGELDEFPFIDNCVKDDVLEFKANKTYVYTDAGEVCVPDGNDAGTWEPIGNNKISVDGTEMTIVSKTATQLVLLTITDLDGNTVSYKATYQRL